MLRRKLSAAVIAAAAAALLVACGTKDAPPPQSAGDETKTGATAPADTPQATTPPPAATPGANVEHSVGETSAPFVLTLQGPPSLPDKGEIELTARLTAANEFKVPATISISLPKGVTLTAGKERESLTSIPAGDTLRSFKVSLSGKIDQPIKVVVDAKDPAGAMGAHAERAYPADLKPVSRPGSNVPPPPVGRPTGVAPKR